jgi:Holliday junction resolvase RusA-like endonuclease
VSFTVQIPVPPSVNGMYRNVAGKGRVLTKAAKRWKAGTARFIQGQVRPSQRIGGAVDVLVELPAKMAGDVDNRLKVSLDTLVLSGRIDDDKHVRQVIARRADDLTDMARITVTPALAYALAGGQQAPTWDSGAMVPMQRRAELRKAGR